MEIAEEAKWLISVWKAGIPTKAEASADVQYSLRLTRGEPWPDPSPPDLSWLDDQPPAGDHSA
ncbi:hypothetical protein [Nonomuraea dietziae]|uniref:hypothetical protein n=1 Tax=Nonomuraea dietziae TaxID=65515 RepID=UPI0033EA8405